MDNQPSAKKKPSLRMSILVLLGTMLILLGGSILAQVSIHILLMIAVLVVYFAAKRLGYTIDDMLESMGSTLTKSIVPLSIFFLIGALIGAWIDSGTVPALIYYGLKIISPAIFLPCALIICSIASVATGTSWGTVGTTGLALMGVGIGMGIPAPMVAGAVISGAIFGDKLSPISDSTVFSAAMADADIYKHIGGMLYVTVPSYIISLVAFTLMGLPYAEASMTTGQIGEISATLANQFNLNPVVLLPMLLVLVLSIKKVPAISTFFIGIFSATIISAIFQNGSIGASLNAINFGYTQATGVELVDTLILRGGIQSMMYTFSVAFIALSFGGMLRTAGFLEVFLDSLLGKIKTAPTLMLAAILSCVVVYAATTDGLLTMVLVGSLYKDAIAKMGLQKRTLSRLLEEGVTLTSPIIPWTTSAIFISGVLGVAPLAYFPYAVLCYIEPILSISLAYCGIFVFWEKGRGKGRKKFPDVQQNAEQIPA